MVVLVFVFNVLNVPLGPREVSGGAILPVVLRVLFVVPVPFQAAWFK